MAKDERRLGRLTNSRHRLSVSSPSSNQGVDNSHVASRGSFTREAQGNLKEISFWQAISFLQFP